MSDSCQISDTPYGPLSTSFLDMALKQKQFAIIPTQSILFSYCVFPYYYLAIAHNNWQQSSQINRAILFRSRITALQSLTHLLFSIRNMPRQSLMSLGKFGKNWTVPCRTQSPLKGTGLKFRGKSCNSAYYTKSILRKQNGGSSSLADISVVLSHPSTWNQGKASLLGLVS